MDGIMSAAAEQKEFEHLVEPSVFNKPSREIRSIFFPTDLSGAGDMAFCHVLKIALCNKCELDIVNILRKKTPRRKRRRFPRIRQTLEQWGALARLPQLGGREDANPLIFHNRTSKGRRYRAPNGGGESRAVRR